MTRAKRAGRSPRSPRAKKRRGLTRAAPEFVPKTDDWKTDEILASIGEEGPAQGRVAVWVLAIFGEVTHALQGEQRMAKEAYDHGLGPGYLDVRWKWKWEGEPDFVLVPNRHWGIGGAIPIYEANVRRWEEVRSRYREKARFDLPVGLSVTLYIRENR